jgi:hypothetical protein
MFTNTIQVYHKSPDIQTSDVKRLFTPNPNPFLCSVVLVMPVLLTPATPPYLRSTADNTTWETLIT